MLGLIGVTLFWNMTVGLYCLGATINSLSLVAAPVRPAAVMGWGMPESPSIPSVLAQWLMLMPFVAIGLYLLGILSMCVGGRIEIEVQNGITRVSTGVGRFGYSRTLAD